MDGAENVLNAYEKYKIVYINIALTHSSRFYSNRSIQHILIIGWSGYLLIDWNKRIEWAWAICNSVHKAGACPDFVLGF